MPRPADAEQLQVNSACLFDVGFVLLAVIVYLVLVQRSVRDMDVLGFDVDRVEQMLSHESDVAL